MLVIFNHNADEIEWHVSEKSNRFTPKVLNAISYIQADGHELEHIKSMFENPDNIFPKGRVVKIYGDLAKTIVANL